MGPTFSRHNHDSKCRDPTFLGILKGALNPVALEELLKTHYILLYRYLGPLLGQTACVSSSELRIGQEAGQE